MAFDIKGKILIGQWFSLSNGSSFLWIGVISANSKGSREVPVLRNSFINLYRNCGNILLSFKIFQEISPPDDIVSSNVEITSSISLEVTGQNEKGFIVMHPSLIFFILGWFLYLSTILLTRFWFSYWFRWVRPFEQSQG